jgi:hypothetical protein
VTAMRRSLLAVLFCLFAAPAAGQTLADYDYEYLSFRGLGVDAGYMWATKVENTEQFSIRLDLGYLGPGVRIIPSLSYWGSRFTDDELDDLATRINQQSGTAVQGEDLGPLKWTDISLSLDGHFVWNTPLDVLTYLGAGLGFHALNGQGDAIDDTFVEDLLDTIAAGVSGIAGVEFGPVDRLRLYGEGRFTAMNSIQYLSVRGGVQFMFSQGDEVTVGGAVPALPPETGTARGSR